MRDMLLKFPSNFFWVGQINPFEDNMELTLDMVKRLEVDIHNKYSFFYAYQNFIADNLAYNWDSINDMWGEYRNLQKMFHANNRVINALIRRCNDLQRMICVAEDEKKTEILVPIGYFDYIHASIEIPDKFIWIGKENCL